MSDSTAAYGASAGTAPFDATTDGEASHGEHGATNRLKSQADELIQAAKQRAKDVASEQKDAAAAQLGCISRGLRDAAQAMRGDSELAGRYAGRAADGLERISQDLSGADFDELVMRTESYARRNPAVFMGAAVATGFLFARFLKSSGGRRHRSPGAYPERAYPERSDAPQGVAAVPS